MSKTYTKLELLDESIWDSLRSAARTGGRLAKGAAVLGANVVDKTLPELTQPFKQGASAVSDIYKKTKGAVESPEAKIKKSLIDNGYILKSPIKQINDRGNVLVTVGILDYDPNTGEAIPDSTQPDRKLILSKDGRIIRDLSQRAANRTSRSAGTP